MPLQARSVLSYDANQRDFLRCLPAIYYKHSTHDNLVNQAHIDINTTVSTPTLREFLFTNSGVLPSNCVYLVISRYLDIYPAQSRAFADIYETIPSDSFYLKAIFDVCTPFQPVLCFARLCPRPIDLCINASESNFQLTGIK